MSLDLLTAQNHCNHNRIGKMLDNEVDYEVNMQPRRRRPLVSFSDVARAIDQKYLNPDSIVVLKAAVTRMEFEELIERDFRALGPLKVKFEPLFDDIGNIVVTLVKTKVHCRATGFAFKLASQLNTPDLGNQGIVIEMEAEGDIRAGNVRREPDAEIAILESGQQTDAIVVEVAYSSPQDPEELREILNWYVTAPTAVRIAVGIHIQYVSPLCPLPDQTSMTMYIQHRGGAISEQVLSFGEDRKEDGPIYAVIESNTFFGGNVPMSYPPRVQVDIRTLRETLMQAIQDHRNLAGRNA